jgi:hypothetical protein
MDEETKRRWDVRLGIVAPILTVAGLLVGVWQFNRGEENKTRLEYELLDRKDKIDFERKLWLERLSVYKTIAETAGKIATTDKSDKKFKDSVEAFDASYWGQMIFVEDAAVEKAMIDFHEEVVDYEQGKSTPERLKLRANELVQKCRESVKPGTAP